MAIEEIKIVFVGDGSVGKTYFNLLHLEGICPMDFIPPVGEVVKLSLWDTAGGKRYSRISSLSYPATSLFVIVFSVVQPYSLANAKEKLAA